MITFNFSCNGCDKRFPGCHSQCETYKKEKKKYEALKAEEDRKKRIMQGLSEQKYNALHKAMRDKRPNKKGNQ